MLVVIVESEPGCPEAAFGPFRDDHEELARQFSEFMSAEVNPARVAPAQEALDLGLPILSPLAQLLAWWEHVCRGAVRPT